MANERGESTTILELQRWIDDRMERTELRVEDRLSELAKEIQNTRHAQRGSLETLTLQVTTLVGEIGRQGQDLRAINEWRAEGGPLDSRFRRHDARIISQETWRSTMRGSLITASLFAPLLTGVVVAIVVSLLPE